MAAIQTDADGGYRIDGVKPGNWVVHTESPWQDEVYDDVPCRRFDIYGACAFTDFTPVPVRLGVATAGIDFSLKRSGAISGKIEDAKTGAPLFGYVALYDAQGAGLGTVYATGEYTLEDLSPGKYFARVDAPGYVWKLYSKKTCEPDCDPKQGTAFVVKAGKTRPGVDFLLKRRGTLKVKVIDMVDGSPLDAQVEAVSPKASMVSGTSDGVATFLGAVTTQYAISAVEYSGNHYSSVWAGYVCTPPAFCDVSKGQRVAVEPERKSSVVIRCCRSPRPASSDACGVPTVGLWAGSASISGALQASCSRTGRPMAAASSFSRVSRREATASRPAAPARPASAIGCGRTSTVRPAAAIRSPGRPSRSVSLSPPLWPPESPFPSSQRVSAGRPNSKSCHRGRHASIHHRRCSRDCCR